MSANWKNRPRICPEDSYGENYQIVKTEDLGNLEEWAKRFEKKMRSFLYYPDKASVELRRFIKKEILGE